MKQGEEQWGGRYLFQRGPPGLGNEKVDVKGGTPKKTNMIKGPILPTQNALSRLLPRRAQKETEKEKKEGGLKDAPGYDAWGEEGRHKVSEPV